ncbi:PH, RCC1 and FYVE domains-containing protein 1-like isoform X1 [Pistacia vera]|uniref:PH, RCC1 and FYVE domains-containing protein 1-like isoform X1 n=1 Tax=Pistacia vera TaxID=55513 RepID=UPI0012636572|nr:PH, RCC1 and FYVE domains-containing protein 1-like isoform X1 [Pistacia vera]
MAESQRVGLSEKDIEQAITALKKGAYLLKYGRRGKPKFCPFKLSNDEAMLIWYSGKAEKHLKLSQVSRISPGQRTAIFQRYPRPEKEYQSFSLICSDRSLDLICKDKDEAEVWFVGLQALITRVSNLKWKNEPRHNSTSSDSPHARTGKNSPSVAPLVHIYADLGDTKGIQVPLENGSQSGLAKAFSEIISYTATPKSFSQAESVASPLGSLATTNMDNSNDRSSAAETVRISLSSAVSSSSHGSCHEDFDSLGDVFIWGEGVGIGVLAADAHQVGNSYSLQMDALLPKALESTVVLDVHSIACGRKHAVLVTKQGEIFSWGEEIGGRLGHGMEIDVPYPKLIETLSGMNIESVACGEYHTCAITRSGDLYTWGDGTHQCGLLGHGSEVSHWIPKRVCGQMDSKHVSYISCGLWHTAVVTSTGQLFTFGDGSFGALGHGDRSSTSIPREVETLIGMRTMRVSCGVWHTAAVIEVVTESSSFSPSSSTSSSKLFTWGDGDNGRLGHGDKEPRLIPNCVASLVDENISRVACGHNLTVALTTSGHVYTMGSIAYGQLGIPTVDGLVPTRVEGKIAKCSVEEIACGSYHVAALTSSSEVYTWGKGTNGQLGHGDKDNRNSPTLVDFLKDKQIKSLVCGSNFTAIICLHKWVSSADHSLCSSCRNPFGFRRKRHNCYNCGLVFCKACSSRKSLKAALAPNMNKPYRVCDDCFNKLKNVLESNSVMRNLKVRNGNMHHKTIEAADRENQGARLQGQLSRLSSADSIKQIEIRHSKHNSRIEFHDSQISPVFSGNFHSKKSLSPPITGSRMTSRTTSPISGKSSPPRFSEVTIDDSKHTNDNLTQEIRKLKSQLEAATSKSQHLEAELERTSKKLKMVTAMAADEVEKCKSAKEVIKSLTAQLKEMAERNPEESTTSLTSGLLAKHISSVQSMLPKESTKAITKSPEGESNTSSVSQTLSHRTKAKTEKAEWVVQDETGVYITLSSISGGGTELKRVRFSRKHFTEQEAEKWWVENSAKVCERYRVQNSD